MTGRGTILALVSVVSLLAASCGNGVEPHKGIEIAQEHLAALRATRRWVKAVNHHGGFDIWDFAVCREPTSLASLLTERCHITR